MIFRYVHDLQKDVVNYHNYKKIKTGRVVDSSNQKFR